MADKLQWGEIDENDRGDLDFLLPPRVIEGPDENGIKKTIEYKFDDDGNKVKVTTTTSVCTLENDRISKKATEHHNWAKFGDAVQAISDDLDGVVMLCRTCGKKGDHWTSKCSCKDLAQAQQTETFVDGPSSTCYVPPRLRGSETSTKRNDEMNSVRVSNLSEDTSKSDVEELFMTFGPVSRVNVAMDEKSGRAGDLGLSTLLIWRMLRGQSTSLIVMVMIISFLLFSGPPQDHFLFVFSF